MMRKRLVPVALAVFLAASPALAQDCAVDVQQAQDSARKMYIDGMGGLASNNFSQRPGTFSKMGCLDKFMQGNMDVFFKPPQLQDLLQQALSFACEQVQQAIGGALGGAGGSGADLGALASLAGGLNVPGGSGGSGQSVNLGQLLQTFQSGSGMAGTTDINTLFGAR